jgi:antitoxin component YwqK of YwqJK toxin-antitoxin module
MKKLFLLAATLQSLTSFSQDLSLSSKKHHYEQVGPYCDTNKCGRWLTYYENGEVAMVETFDEKGKLKGERVTFTTGGIIKHYTEWKEGVKVGKEIYFDENGNPIRFINHELDKKNEH